MTVTSSAAVGTAPGRGGRLLGRVLAGAEADIGDPLCPLRHSVRLEERHGRPVPWPTWVPAGVVAALQARGVAQPWSHQAEGAELAHAGHDVVVATGTASGKSLVY